MVLSWRKSSFRDPLPDSSDQTEELQVPSETAEQVNHVPEVRRSSRIVHAPEIYIGTHEKTSNDVEPLTFNDAMSREDSEKWLSAMKSELQSMEDNQV